MSQVSDNSTDDSYVAEQGSGVCQEPCDDGQCERPLDEFRRLCCPGGRACWTFTADAIALQRTTTRDQPLFVNADGADLLSSKNMEFPVATALQVGAIRHGPCGWDLELGYFQIDGWNASGNVPGPSEIVTDVNGGNFFITDGQARYTSQLHIGELNLRHEWLDGLTLLVGLRLGELDELYSATGLGARIPAPVNFDASTFNHLYGLQVGADYEFYNMGGPLKVSALCKAGVYDNVASQRSHQIDTSDPTSEQTIEATRNQAAFMGETGLVATYRVTCHLSFRATATAVWLEGVALAPEQISATDFMAGTATIDTHGSIFYYGGGLGMEVKY